MPQFQAMLVESLTRRQYWLIIAAIMLVLIGLSVWMGFYYIDEPPVDAEGRAVQHSNPLEAFAWTPLGNAVILAVIQFAAANALLWSLIGIARLMQSR